MHTDILIRRLARLLLLALLATTPVAQAAQPADCRPDSRTAACRYTQGVLWKIERAGKNASHLFGTIHLSDPRVTTLPVPVRRVFDTARSFSMEMLIDAEAMQEMTRVSLLADGRTLDAVIGTERFAAVERGFTTRGLPTASLKFMQPWIVAVTLTTPAQMNFLDLQLHSQALQQQKPVYGLETAREQLSTFTELSLDEQILLLDEALESYPKMGEQVEDLTQAYLARDIAGIARLMKKYGLRNQRLNDKLMHRLLDERNKRMVERMRPRLDEGGAFIAVGVGHLGGEQGLLALLERAGWRVAPVY